MLFTLVGFVAAHMHITSPVAQFTNGRGDENAPSGFCGSIQYSPDSASVVLNRFKSGMPGTLLDFFTACGTRTCGNTNPNFVVAAPRDNLVKLSIGARHVGLVEIWLGGRRVVQSDQLLDQYSVDFSQCQGTCQLRFIMAALHNFPAELYDNCVMVTNDGSNPPAPVPPVSTQAPPTQPNLPIVTQAPPKATDRAPTQPNVPVITQVPPQPTNRAPPAAKPPVVQQPSKEQVKEPNAKPITQNKEWSCSSDYSKLIRTVSGVTYEFACAPGTKCTYLPNLSWPVCDFKY